MDWKKEIKILAWIVAICLGLYFMPMGDLRFDEAILASFDLVRWYAREHVILCLLPAFFIAGFISVFISHASVIKYFGAHAKKRLAYVVASVSGTILAVCSCTVLPLFSSIHRKGAGLGPAIAFLYSGPAINILAIILTARILGWEMGLARVVGAVAFSMVIGLVMSLVYRKEEKEKSDTQMHVDVPPEKRPLWQTAFHFLVLVFILVFANWGKPESTSGMWYIIWSGKWAITSVFAVLLMASLIFILRIRWFLVIMAGIVTAVSAMITTDPVIPVIIGIAALVILTITDQHDEQNREWTLSAWDFAKQILPLLLIGVLIAGFLLGSVHDTVNKTGIIPNELIVRLLGGNSIFSNLFASAAGAFMYFATLTEVPIVQGLIASGMGKGPALALLLAGPALSLPNMLVIRSVMGTQKTLAFVSLVIIMATLSGIIFGEL